MGHTLKYQIIPNTKYFTYRLPNNLNSHNSVSFKASSPKFCMVVYLHNTNRPYHAILYHKTPNNTIPQHTKSYQIPNISNSHNSVLFQTRCPKFSVLVDSNRPYHTISYPKIPNHTKYQIFHIPITK